MDKYRYGRKIYLDEAILFQGFRNNVFDQLIDIEISKDLTLHLASNLVYPMIYCLTTSVKNEWIDMVSFDEKTTFNVKRGYLYILPTWITDDFYCSLQSVELIHINIQRYFI